MDIRFEKKYLEELYFHGKTSDKKHRFQPNVVSKYRKTIDLLESLSVVEDLFRFKSLHYEALVGDKAGIESVRVNDQYRIKFGYTPTHPGEVLKDEIEYRKISQRQLAERMGVSYKALNDLLNGRRSLTVVTAMMFEAALDIPADSLMRLQVKYNMQKASSDSKFLERLKQIRKYAALF